MPMVTQPWRCGPPTPYRITLPSDFVLELSPEFLRVVYEVDGATITAFQETELGLLPIGRATVEGGAAVLRYVEQPVEGAPILLSASLANAVTVP